MLTWSHRESGPLTSRESNGAITVAPRFGLVHCDAHEVSHRIASEPLVAALLSSPCPLCSFLPVWPSPRRLGHHRAACSKRGVEKKRVSRPKALWLSQRIVAGLRHCSTAHRRTSLSGFDPLRGMPVGWTLQTNEEGQTSRMVWHCGRPGKRKEWTYQRPRAFGGCKRSRRQVV